MYKLFVALLFVLLLLVLGIKSAIAYNTNYLEIRQEIGCLTPGTECDIRTFELNGTPLTLDVLGRAHQTLREDMLVKCVRGNRMSICDGIDKRMALIEELFYPLHEELDSKIDATVTIWGYGNGRAVAFNDQGQFFIDLNGNKLSKEYDWISYVDDEGYATVVDLGTNWRTDSYKIKIK